MLEYTQEMAKTAVGTPLYVAPEVIMGKNYDAKADVWSLGCTFYEIITHTLPFKGSNLEELKMKIRQGKYKLINSDVE